MNITIFSRILGRVCVVLLAALLGFGVFVHPVRAQGAETPAPEADGNVQSPPSQNVDPKVREVVEAWEAAKHIVIRGPASVTLLDQATLNLPPQMAFVPKAEGSRILRSYGNLVGDDFVGLIVSMVDDENWLVAIRYVKEGYVSDSDARDWNADELLANIKTDTDHANEERVRRNFPQVRIIGWIERPTYDASRHHLVWSLSSKTEGQPPSADDGVNYNTYALGREGYFSLDLVTRLSVVEGQKSVAQQLLGNLAYLSGKRYEDFNNATDKVAAYGLAALIGGVAAKKIGLFAVALAFAAKFAKLVIAAIIAFGVMIAKIFRRRS